MKIEEAIEIAKEFITPEYLRSFDKEVGEAILTLIAHSQNYVSEEEIKEVLSNENYPHFHIVYDITNPEDWNRYWEKHNKSLAKALASLLLRKEVSVEEISSIVYKILNNKIFEKEDGAVIMPPSQSCGLSNSIAQAIIERIYDKQR